MRTEAMTQLNLSIPISAKHELKRLCDESGVSLSRAIQDYIAASSKAGRLITTETTISPTIIQLVKEEVLKELNK